jgi:hypothetical protein
MAIDPPSDKLEQLLQQADLDQAKLESVLQRHNLKLPAL